MRPPQVRVPALEEVYGDIIMSLAQQRGVSEEAIARVTPASLRLVRLEPEGIFMGATFVTQFVYFAVTGKNPSHFHNEKDADGDYTRVGEIEVLLNHPVESLTRAEEDEFFALLREAAELRHPGIDGQMRRPTEAEWVAADGGKEWSDAEVRAHTWADADRTHAVAQKPANARGIHESRGHVSSALEVLEGSYRPLRGGSWGYDARYVRAAQRYYYRPFNRYYRPVNLYYYFGFRVVRSAAGPVRGISR